MASFALGFLVTTYLVGGYFFERDLKLLEVNWQEVTPALQSGWRTVALYGYLYSYNFHRCLARGIVFFASKFWIALVVQRYSIWAYGFNCPNRLSLC